MKFFFTKLLFVCLILTATVLNAQAPSSFNYQAVIRNGSGAILASQLVDLRFTVRSGSATGTVLYQETKALSTSQYGVVSHAVGTGSIVSGTFAGITWSTTTNFLQVEVNTGSGFVDLGAQQLVSVPYALNAKTADLATNATNATNATSATTSLDNRWTLTGNNITNNNAGNVGIGVSSAPVNKLQLGGDMHMDGNTIYLRADPADKFDLTRWNSTADKVEVGGYNGVILGYTSPAAGIVVPTLSTSGGYVGIGTTTPTTNLDIRDANPSILVASPTGTMGAVYFGNTSHGVKRNYSAGNDVGLYTTAADLYLSANGAVTNQFVLKNNGNVGIGLAAPGSKLEVAGSTKFSGGYALLCTSADNTQGNVGMGNASYSNVKLTIGTSQNYGIYVNSGTTNAAIYANGNIQCTGTMSKGGGSFKIDDPIDPANKYLYHSFVESPDMMNIYNGNVTTDANGVANVTMPAYFEALNQDFRYQLTVIGAFAQAMVSEEIAGNKFQIKTDKPNMKVSWQVTGIRHDAFAQKNRIPNEVEKSVDEKGKYLHPDCFGLPEEMRINPGKPVPADPQTTTVQKQ